MGTHKHGNIAKMLHVVVNLNENISHKYIFICFDFLCMYRCKHVMMMSTKLQDIYEEKKHTVNTNILQNKYIQND